MYIKNRIDVISMGCSKNLIDSERLMKQLDSKGYSVVHDSDDVCGEYVVVNTCGFINDAKEESIMLILNIAEAKKEGKIGSLIVMGCLSQRYLDDLCAEIPEVDEWYGKFDWKSFIEKLPDLKKSKSAVPEWDRIVTTPPHSAYIKISEGCNRFCAFCAIPIITGRYKSRPIEEILDEVRSLVGRGVKEFNVIAQDLSSYGLDLYGSHTLAQLIDSMADVPGVEWIRLHYAYPTDFPYDILDVMAKRKNICKYLDIALQHSSDRVLENMRRHITLAETEKLLEEIRSKVPDIRLRTTLMVGFPGEGEKEFEELERFVKEQRFDRMGAFAYSEEDDTWAAKNLEDSIPQETKQTRLDRLMDLQEKISMEENEKLVGRKLRVLVDSIENGKRICRTEWDSPEVDQTVTVETSDAMPGDFINVEITEAYPFDLLAKQCEAC